MKLYYASGACSLAPHIVAREAGLKIDLDKLDFATGKTESGETFAEVNPKGYVPALRLDNGEVLTEVATLVQYLADQAPQSGLVRRAACPMRRSRGRAALRRPERPKPFRAVSRARSAAGRAARPRA